MSPLAGVILTPGQWTLSPFGPSFINYALRKLVASLSKGGELIFFPVKNFIF